jgi:hypothetical protein
MLLEFVAIFILALLQALLWFSFPVCVCRYPISKAISYCFVWAFSITMFLYWCKTP